MILLRITAGTLEELLQVQILTGNLKNAAKSYRGCSTLPGIHQYFSGFSLVTNAKRKLSKSNKSELWNHL